MTAWTVSIVSHGHGGQVLSSLRALQAQLGDCRLILTLNIPDDEAFLAEAPRALRQRLEIRRNTRPLGFAANHNAALADCNSEFLLIADPCLGLPEPIFDAIEGRLSEPDSGIVSPQACTPDGRIEDNGRALVTPAALLRHYLLRETRAPASRSDRAVQPVEWLAGLFLAMRRETFERLGGFDAGYFLYCEDVDLCLRTRQLGLAVELLPQLTISHAANRDTRRKWRHFLWHVGSLLRLWRSAPYRWARRQTGPTTG